MTIYALIQIKPDAVQNSLNAASKDGWELHSLNLSEEWAVLFKSNGDAPAPSPEPKTESPVQSQERNVSPAPLLQNWGGYAACSAGAAVAAMGASGILQSRIFSASMAFLLTVVLASIVHDIKRLLKKG